MGDRLTQAARLVLHAAARLLVLLSAAYLVYEVRLRAAEPAYHPLYGFFRYIVGLVTFRPGVTPSGIPTVFYVGPALARSAALLTASTVAAMGAGYAFARWNFVHGRRRMVERVERIGSIAYSLPIAALAMLFFAVAAETGWFPIGGTTSSAFSSLGLGQQILDLIHHAALPWLSLTLFPALMLVRSGLRAVGSLQGEDYIAIARSHGFSSRELFRHHARKPILGRLLTDLSGHLPLIVTYLVIVELVFRYTGVGYYTVQPYSGFWGSRGSDVFAVSQAALVYVGAGTVVAQLVLRLTTIAVVPRMRGTVGQDARGRLRMFATVALVAVAGTWIVAAAGAWETEGDATGARRAVAAAAVAVALVALVISRDARAERSTGQLDSPAEPDGRDRDPPPVTGSERDSSWRAIFAWVALAVLVVVPWLVRPPARPPTTLLVRPDFLEHPELIWYFFARTFVTGRFLLVVLVTTATGAVAGLILGTFAGYYRVELVDRGVSFIEVIPSILVAALVAGVATHAGAPIAITVAVAAAVTLYEPARRSGVELAAAEFTTYGRAIGENRLEELRRHLAPNLAVQLGPRFPGLYGDMIVLTVNLGFLRLAPIGGAADTDGAVASFFRAIGWDWGSLIAMGRSDFVRGTYLPAVWPIVFLVATLLLVRSVGAAGDRR